MPKSFGFAADCILPVPGARVDGEIGYRWTDSRADFVRLTPNPGTETWAVFQGPGGKAVAAEFVVGTNALGGCVGVLAFGLVDCRAPGVYNQTFQDMMRHFFDRASNGRLDAVSTKTPRVWLYNAVSNDGKELLTMINNLSGDSHPDLTVEYGVQWRGGTVERLMPDGGWRKIGTASEAFVADGMDFPPMVPEFFKVTRK